MSIEDQILKEVKEVKTGVNENAVSLARVEGDIKLHTSQIDRNSADIQKHETARKDSDRRLHERIEGVDGKLNKIVLRVLTAATAAGTAAGGAINAVMTKLNGG